MAFGLAMWLIAARQMFHRDPFLTAIGLDLQTLEIKVFSTKLPQSSTFCRGVSSNQAFNPLAAVAFSQGFLFGGIPVTQNWRGLVYILIGRHCLFFQSCTLPCGSRPFAEVSLGLSVVF